MTKRETHLTVFVHGAKGYGKDVAAPAKLLEETYPGQISTLVSTVNEGNLLYDGIDVCGSRLAQEIYDHVITLQDTYSVTKFSVFGYSMGGIISRFAIGLLANEKFFDNIELVNFVSFASPHLGLYHPYDSIFAKIINAFMNVVYCPLVSQFAFKDNSYDHIPVYKLLADPNFIFYKTLAKFKNKRLYVNATGDGIIPYYSAAIDNRGLFDSFPNMNIKFSPDHPSIIKEFDDMNEGQNKRTGSLDNPRHFFFMFLLFPFITTWVGIPAYYRYYRDKKKFRKGKNGFWAINKKSTVLNKRSKEDNKKFTEESQEYRHHRQQEEEQEQGQSVWNPLPGRYLSSKNNCMKQHPVQTFMYNHLSQLDFDRALVHLNTNEAHIAIVGIKGTESYAAPLFKHFVSTFQV